MEFIQKWLLDKPWEHRYIIVILLVILWIITYLINRMGPYVERQILIYSFDKKQILTKENVKKNLGNFPLILDVRSREEYMKCHLPDSINMEYSTIISNPEILNTNNVLMDEHSPVFIYCRSGRRALIVANYLIHELGHRRDKIFISLENCSDLVN